MSCYDVFVGIANAIFQGDKKFAIVGQYQLYKYFPLYVLNRVARVTTSVVLDHVAIQSIQKCSIFYLKVNGTYPKSTQKEKLEEDFVFIAE